MLNAFNDANNQRLCKKERTFASKNNKILMFHEIFLNYPYSLKLDSYFFLLVIINLTTDHPFEYQYF